MLERIRSEIAAKRWFTERHGVWAMAKRGIRFEDVRLAIGDQRSEVIEEYPEGLRGRSCLILGWVQDRPLHVLCTDTSPVLVVTAYRPDERRWLKDWKTRRKAH